MRCPNKNSKEWKELTSINGESGAYQKYVINGFDIPKAEYNDLEIVRLHESEIDVALSKGTSISEYDFKSSRLGKTRGGSISKKLANQLKNISGTDIKIISEKDALNFLKAGEYVINTKFPVPAGFWVKETKTAYIVEEYMDDATIIHEAFMHPFVDYLYYNKPALYNNLLELAKKDESIVKHVSENYDKSSVYYEDEHITHAMDLYSGNRARNIRHRESSVSEKINRRVKEILSYFKALIRDTFGLNKLENLNDSLTFGQLYDIITNSKEYYDINLDIVESSSEINEVPFRMIDPKNLSNDIEEINTRLKDAVSHVEFLSEDHIYRNRITGEEYTSSTTLKAEAGYGDILDAKFNTEQFSKDYLFAGEVGTAIHEYIDVDARGVGDTFDAKKYITISDKAKKEIQGINAILNQHSNMVFSEQIVVDDNTMSSGMVDRMVQRKDNSRNIQLDFKTKIVNTYDIDGVSQNSGVTGKDRRPFSWYETSKPNYSGKPDKLKHGYQQELYKTMLEMHGVRVDQRGIVPLEVIIRTDKSGNKYIDEVRFTKDLPLDPKLKYHNLVQNFEISKKVDVHFGIKKTPLDKIEELRLVELDNISKDGLHALKMFSAELDSKNRSYQANILKSKLQLSDNHSPVHEAYNMIMGANDVINRYYKRYQELLEEEREAGINDESIKSEEIWGIKVAKEWRDFTDAIGGTINQLQIFHEENPKYFESIQGVDINEFNTTLETLISNKNTLHMAYETKVMPRWVRIISDRTKTVEWERRVSFRNDYKTKHREENKGKNKKFTKEDESKMQIAEDAYIKKNADSIKQATIDFVKKQAKIADHDTHFLNRWLTTVYDTQDPIVGVTMKIQYDTLMEMRDTHRTWQIKLSNLMDRFDKKVDAKSFDNQKEVYDYMIESRADGSFGLISKVTDEFNVAKKEAFQKILSDNGGKRNAEVFKQESLWLDTHAPTVKDYDNKVRDSKKLIFSELLDNGDITSDEYIVLMSNEDQAKPSKPFWLFNNGKIRQEVSFLLNDLYIDISWSHRIPSPKLYPNPKYDALMKMDKADPRRELYELMIDTQEMGNAMLNTRFNKGTQLPGIRKNMQDRYTEGQNIYDIISTSTKEKFQSMEDEDQRGVASVFTDPQGKPILSVPMYYTTALTETDQNFDIPSIMNQWYHSALSYNFTTQNLPELEYTQFIINRRKVRKKDGFNRFVKNRLANMFNASNMDIDSIEDLVVSETNNLADQYNEWMRQSVYGIKESTLPQFFGGKIDTTKLLSAIQSFTSFKIMGVNFMSMMNNYAMAEVSQIVEVASGELMDKATYHKASIEYTKQMSGIIGDIGSRRFSNKVNVAMEYFNLFTERDQYHKFRDKSISKRLFKDSALYATTQFGEHVAQSRFLIGALMSVDVKDRNGKSVGNLWENLDVSDEGIMTINDRVDGDVTELRNSISRKVTQTIREMHGNYTDYTTTAMSSNGIAKLLMQFRHWAPSGFNRRMQRHHFSEFSEMEKEGYIRSGVNTGMDYAKHGYYNIRKYFNLYVDEVKAAEIAMKSDWSYLTDLEKKNAIRVITDASAFLLAHMVFRGMVALKDRDDFKESNALYRAFINNLMYQSYRLNLEQTSYINPFEAKQMMNSPMAGMSFLEGWGDVINQMGSPTEKYKTGPRKGDYKMNWKIFNQIPIVRQFYRVAHADDALTALQR